MMSLGTGLTLLVAIALIDSNLRAQIGDRLPGAVPSFFFIDIQDAQAAAFDATAAAIPGVSSSRRVPTLRGRIVAIGGVPVETAPIAPEAEWAVRGDRALTYAATAPEGARVVAGSWWPADYTGDPLVSLDAGLAEGFGVGVGDRLTLNVLGRDIEVGIASLREIEWRAVPFDFALILAPGTLEGAPHTHIAAVYADPAAEPMLDKAIADRFSNITSIQTREALEAVNQILVRVGWGVRAAAAVSVLAGILVLTGAIAADRRRRQYEAVLFKVLGATRARIAGIYLIEFAALGLVTAVIAAALAAAVAWAVVVQLMQFDWTPRIDIIVATIVVCTVLAVLAGFVGTWRHLSGSAAPLLRDD
ncbi:MAG: ABC transporter permease [Rhodoplanes sp.]